MKCNNCILWNNKLQNPQTSKGSWNGRGNCWLCHTVWLLRGATWQWILGNGWSSELLRLCLLGSGVIERSLTKQIWAHWNVTAMLAWKKGTVKILLVCWTSVSAPCHEQSVCDRKTPSHVSSRDYAVKNGTEFGSSPPACCEIHLR